MKNIFKCVPVLLVSFALCSCSPSEPDDEFYENLAIKNSLDSIELAIAEHAGKESVAKLAREEIRLYLKNNAPDFRVYYVVYIYDVDSKYSALIVRGDERDLYVKMDLSSAVEHERNHGNLDAVVTVRP